MEQKRVSIYHTCTVQHVRELIPLLKIIMGNNLPQTELSVTEQGYIYFKNRVAWELPLNQQSPRNEGEARDSAEYWLTEARKREANAYNLFKNTQNKAESYLPLFFHTNWIFLKALPEYSDKNLLRYWKVIYSLKLTSIEGLPKGEARVVPDHQLVLYIKYKNPSLLPAIDYISRPIFKAEAVQSLLHFEEADIPNLRMIENAANHTISPYKMADDGNWVAMTEVGAEKPEPDKITNTNCFTTIGTITIHIVLHDDTILSDSICLRDEGCQVTEWDALVGNIIRIFESNHVDATIISASKQEVDTKQRNNELGVNDYIVNILNKEIDTKNSLGFSVTGISPNSMLTDYFIDNNHTEYPIFISYKLAEMRYRPNTDTPPTYIIESDKVFFEILANVCAHEVYHSIIDRALKYAAFSQKDYPFGKVLTKKEEDNLPFGIRGSNYFEDNGHNPLNKDDMFMRAKQYSLNTSGLHTQPFAYLTELSMRADTSNGFSLLVNLSLNKEDVIDVFFLNPYIILKKEDIPPEIYADIPIAIREALEPTQKTWKIWKGRLTRASAAAKINLFRNDDIQKKYVEPFLKQFKVKDE